MTARPLRLVQLYPTEMNIYGDHGNRAVLLRRMALYGFSSEFSGFEPGDDGGVLAAADLVLGGGGQDSGQVRVAADLRRVGAVLRERAEAGVPMLLVCGLYQLFGHGFRPLEGEPLDGIGVFDAQTVAGPHRLIGNTTTTTDLGQLVGYENHSGLTTLNAGQAPLGRVMAGAGNNGTDGTEGARTRNAMGTYLHGPVLPKNPALADELLRLAARVRHGIEVLTTPDAASAVELARLDDLAARARTAALARPR